MAGGSSGSGSDSQPSSSGEEAAGALEHGQSAGKDREEKVRAGRANSASGAGAGAGDGVGAGRGAVSGGSGEEDAVQGTHRGTGWSSPTRVFGTAHLTRMKLQ